MGNIDYLKIFKDLFRFLFVAARKDFKTFVIVALIHSNIIFVYLYYNESKNADKRLADEIEDSKLIQLQQRMNCETRVLALESRIAKMQDTALNRERDFRRELREANETTIKILQNIK